MKRVLLSGVVQSVLLYGAPVWYAVLEKKVYLNIVERLQRRIMLRVASAFRTVSTMALQVITATIPLELHVKERTYMYENGGLLARASAREETLRKWQEKWDENDSKGQWTKKLIPDIEPWIGCKFRKLDYYLTQFLTGHGVFRAYAMRFGNDTVDRCAYCEKEDTVQHTIFECHRWNEVRSLTNTKLCEDLKCENIIGIMMSSEKKWSTIHGMVITIMKEKEKEERKRQAGVDIRVG